MQYPENTDGSSCTTNTHNLFLRFHCRICNTPVIKDSNYYTVEEKNFGFHDKFNYFQCPQCECLQIAEIPADLEKYYPENFWAKLEMSKYRSNNPIHKFLFVNRTRFLLGKTASVGRFFDFIRPLRPTPVFGDWNWCRDFKKFGVNLDSAILDVGCEYGHLLCFLKDQGFSNLTGIDAYIDGDIISDAIKIYKKELRELDQVFDFICLHHSFEHMAKPEEELKHLHRLLKPGGIALIRIPVVPCYAWEKYRENWVQIDAPRHLYIHSLSSMKILSEKCGFEIGDIIYDSTVFQFWRSEDYVNGRTGRGNSISYYSDEKLAEYSEHSIKLNQTGQGDQAGFYLKKMNGFEKQTI